ncbi:hypothetical protein NDU88_004838, partial [Pleurodeles waltl]
LAACTFVTSCSTQALRYECHCTAAPPAFRVCLNRAGGEGPPRELRPESNPDTRTAATERALAHSTAAAGGAGKGRAGAQRLGDDAVTWPPLPVPGSTLRRPGVVPRVPEQLAPGMEATQGSGRRALPRGW